MDGETLKAVKALAPFDGMDEPTLRSALEGARIIDLARGDMVFRRRDDDGKIHWLLDGTLDLLDENFQGTSLSAEDEAARAPVDDASPHRLTAVTTGQCRLLVCDRADLQALLGQAPIKVKVKAEAEDDDWMTALLASPLFEFVPPTNIQGMFAKFETVTLKAGEVVFRQDEPGDHFFVIRNGRAKVERVAEGDRVLVAELRPGDGFGQDALVGEAPRNATVTMTESGDLMRLAKPDFQGLLANPVIETITREEVSEMERGDGPAPQVIDVRTAEEARRDPVPHGLNLPLLQLRSNLGMLRRDCVLVLAPGDKRAELGAYTLNEHGFTAYVLAE